MSLDQEKTAEWLSYQELSILAYKILDIIKGELRLW